MAASATRFTEVEYLALEAVSDTKHEFVNGSIVGMAGATAAHNALSANAIVALAAVVRGRGCLVLTSDQRVHVPTTGLYAYPDVTVACGERRYKNDKPPSLLNPDLIVEVTSPTTEDFDRGSKFVHYQAIESLREYVVVSHSERRVDTYRRTDSGHWVYAAFKADDAFEALGGSIKVADLYAEVDLAEGT